MVLWDERNQAVPRDAQGVSTDSGDAAAHLKLLQEHLDALTLPTNDMLKYGARVLSMVRFAGIDDEAAAGMIFAAMIGRAKRELDEAMRAKEKQ